MSSTPIAPEPAASANSAASPDAAGPTRTPEFEKRLAKRYRSERNFRALGLGAIGFSIAALVFLLANMLINGVPGLQRAELAVEIDFAEAGVTGDEVSLTAPSAIQVLEMQGLPGVVDLYAERSLGEEGADELYQDAWRDVARALTEDPGLIYGSTRMWLPASSDLASGLNGEGSSEMQALAERLQAEGKLAKNWDWGFFARSDATSPQMAGIWGALKGSILTMLVTFVLAFPVGILAALYLEEYAPKNRWTDLIEVSINNLAGCPRSFSACSASRSFSICFRICAPPRSSAA